MSFNKKGPPLVTSRCPHSSHWTRKFASMMQAAGVALQKLTGAVLKRYVLNGPEPSKLEQEENADSKSAASATAAGAELLKRTQALHGDFVVVEEQAGVYVSRVDYDRMQASSEWNDYTLFARTLWTVQLTTMSVPQRIAFLINVYNALLFHAQIGRFLSSHRISKRISCVQVAACVFTHNVIL